MTCHKSPPPPPPHPQKSALDAQPQFSVLIRDIGHARERPHQYDLLVQHAGYFGGVEEQQHGLAGDEEEFKGIVLEHIAVLVYLHHLMVFPRQQDLSMSEGRILMMLGSLSTRHPQKPVLVGKEWRGEGGGRRQSCKIYATQ